MCVTSLCTRGALDTWPRGRSTAALGGTIGRMSSYRDDMPGWGDYIVMRDRFIMGVFVLVAWVFAVAIPPAIAGIVAAPDFMLSALLALLYAYMAYTGVRAWRRQWRSRFIIRIVVPVCLLCGSTALTVSGVWARLLA